MLERVEWWWERQLADAGVDEVIRSRHGVVARSQLLAAGWSIPRIRQPLRGRRWQVVHPGVYATHTGPIRYDERLVAALLYAGPAAAWSHHTAAEQLGLRKPDPNRPVHIVIPDQRRVRSQPGLVVHRDAHWAHRLARAAPPRRTPAHAVLDIVGSSRSLDDAAAVIAEACQSGRVGSCDLLDALSTTGGSMSRAARARPPSRSCRFCAAGSPPSRRARAALRVR
ncbi:hypothetical protein HPO96_25105 [Kribbella sandramycini]|uniref:Uncharacterized protein n=1 Tax=Kribbella sandramycini TaxID=60450 RepID=A0A7Y4L359_9ACTN|nr:hypothetical protein [Kribbella sandramycini]MBB6571063.1 hypothetical protein [Kribbella sandramycini]NOL43528.1 hypothetical protein [Kribbella sandramycini]